MATTFSKVLQTVGVSDFRAELARYLAKAKREPLVISERRGGDTYVVLSARDYNALVEAREDAIDAAELMRLVERDKGEEMIPWEKVRESI